MKSKDFTKKISEAVPKKIVSDLKSEITGKDYDSDSFGSDEEALKKIMKKNGWKLIGRGTYGIVFSHPNKKYILKFTTERDKYYQAFVKLTNSVKNRYFPRITEARTIKIKNTVYYSYAMEKLSKAPAALCSQIGGIAEDLDHCYDAKEKSHMIEQWKKKGKLSAYPKLIETIRMLVEIADKRGYSLSIWGGSSPNILQRSDGTPVITDPWC